MPYWVGTIFPGRPLEAATNTSPQHKVRPARPQQHDTTSLRGFCSTCLAESRLKFSRKVPLCLYYRIMSNACSTLVLHEVHYPHQPATAAIDRRMRMTDTTSSQSSTPLGCRFEACSGRHGAISSALSLPVRSFSSLSQLSS